MGTFIERLASSTLSPKTIRHHVDNLWLLGGETNRDPSENSSLKEAAMEQVPGQVIHEDGGPPVHDGSEEEQRFFR